MAFPNPIPIFSVSRQANLVPGDIGWPIIRPQPLILPLIFWNIVSVPGAPPDQYSIQNVQNNMYLAPGGDLNTCVLRAEPFKWRIVPAPSGDNINPVKLYNISNPANGNLLQSGFRFQNPSNAYAVLSQPGDAGFAVASWVIAELPQGN